MTVADALSRTYVLDKSEHYKGKLDHNKGVLIKHPFLPGQVISPGDIIDLINQEDDLICQALEGDDNEDLPINKCAVASSCP